MIGWKRLPGFGCADGEPTGNFIKDAVLTHGLLSYAKRSLVAYDTNVVPSSSHTKYDFIINYLHSIFQSIRVLNNIPI